MDAYPAGVLFSKLKTIALVIFSVVGTAMLVTGMIMSAWEVMDLWWVWADLVVSVVGVVVLVYGAARSLWFLAVWLGERFAEDAARLRAVWIKGDE